MDSSFVGSSGPFRSSRVGTDPTYRGYIRSLQRFPCEWSGPRTDVFSISPIQVRDRRYRLKLPTVNNRNAGFCHRRHFQLHTNDAATGDTVPLLRANQGQGTTEFLGREQPLARATAMPFLIC